MLEARLKNNQEGGIVMVSIVIFFLILSLILVLTVSSSAARDVRIVHELGSSAQSYMLADSLLEDLAYRARFGLQSPDEASLIFGEHRADAEIVEFPGNIRRIVSTGNVNNHFRTSQADLVLGGGIAFHLGVQVGNGGIHLENNAFVEGNIHSGGPITGSSGSYISGSAIVAGPDGLIDDIAIGSTTTDEAWANVVTNSDITGSLYCQTGSGNNKSCDTSRSDAEESEFPVTQEYIDAWKDMADEGELIVGDYIVPSSQTTSLGPAKITGALDFGSNAVLNLTGILWVEDDITTGNNSVIQVDPSHEEGSEIVLTDGNVTLWNNAIFMGTEEDSYIMLLTTSSSSQAIKVDNNAGTVVLNAQNGGIHFSNDSGAKQATAHSMFLDNGASIIYETGLADLHFSTGPSGGFEFRFWGEIE